jgi:hypothetical protein
MPVTAGPIYPGVKDGLVFAIDPANKDSWAGPTSDKVNNLISYNFTTGSIFNDPSGSYGVNESFLFDGASDYIEFPYSDVNSYLNGVSQFTWSNWMKRNASNSKLIIAKGTSLSNDISFEFWSDGNCYVEMGNGSNAYGSFSNNSTDWQLLTMVFDGTLTGNSNRLKAYLNGTQQSLSMGGTINSTTHTNNGNLTIGKVEWQGGTFSHGEHGPFLIYNRALSAGEVLQNYNRLKGRFGLS